MAAVTINRTYGLVSFRLMVLYATFNNISVISWRSVLLWPCTIFGIFLCRTKIPKSRIRQQKHGEQVLCLSMVL